MRAKLIAALIMSTALAGACSNEQKSAEQTSPASTQPAATAAAPAQPAEAQAAITPEQLGELGAQIEKQPDKAHELLAARGLDEKRFEQEIRRVTESPDASKRYAEAYKKAKA